ncbi:hypothetical protein PGT21_030855 [Puccinia graminis f. sp. tritici]|uniref:Uncharacterized protein n=1 Tax=Puccinia graminis f. sp. tritici TaxID=56615 RepID=A0A5B0NDJ2_PUCGR|nr:hypothetical protein PGT21_030855 [Puccinia graminis f. sp. tritici]
MAAIYFYVMLQAQAAADVTLKFGRNKPPSPSDAGFLRDLPIDRLPAATPAPIPKARDTTSKTKQ